MVADMKLIPQRFPSQRMSSRGFAILAAAVLCLFFLTASRLRHGAMALPPDMMPQHSPGDPAPAKEKPDSPLAADEDKLSLAQTANPPTTSIPDEGDSIQHHVDRPPLAPGECVPEIEFLRSEELDLTESIVYSRRCIKPIWGKSDRNAITRVESSLFPQTTTINLSSCSDVQEIPCEPLELHVPYAYPPKQYRHIIFGVASNYERIQESVSAFAHWLAGTEALLVGVIVDAEDGEEPRNLTALEEQYKAWDVQARFLVPQLKKRIGNSPEEEEQPIPVEQHHFMLIRDLMSMVTSKTRWLGILDDDTFFPSLYPVDQELSKYDPEVSYWLGALSDSFDSVRNWGYMAFGGAGVFMSLPLARQLEPILEHCVRTSSVRTGDGILRDCVYQNTRTKLTLVPGLNQHDIRGDASGYFESGARPLSVHHWKSWYQDPMPKMAAVTGLCGDCFLQRWKFGSDVIFTNGYSIAKYHRGLLDKLDLDYIEDTWQSADHDFDFSYGPLRPKLSKSQKRSYKLKDVEVTSNGDFRQVYVYTGNDEAGEMDEVIELLWQGD